MGLQHVFISFCLSLRALIPSAKISGGVVANAITLCKTQSCLRRHPVSAIMQPVGQED